jgi:hypothetical protein
MNVNETKIFDHIRLRMLLFPKAVTADVDAVIDNSCVCIIQLSLLSIRIIRLLTAIRAVIVIIECGY